MSNEVKDKVAEEQTTTATNVSVLKKLNPVRVGFMVKAKDALRRVNELERMMVHASARMGPVLRQ